ncbi:hypothetical protein FAI40_04505 [Acetobacteraceae bacterium]|nr:hypothetical protein FAI40_04505 [Acetobacteraceae bacterium]
MFDLSRFLGKNAPHEALAGAEHLSFKNLSKELSSQNLLKKQVGKTEEGKVATKTAQKSRKAENPLLKKLPLWEKYA